MKARFSIIISVATLAFVFIVYTLFVLQVQRGAQYAQRAAAQQLISGAFDAERGSISITDKNGAAIPAAVNKNFQLIFAVPADIDDVDEGASQIAAVLGVDAATIRPRLLNKASKYEKLIEKATDEQARAVEKAEVAGLYVTSWRGRDYPYGSLAAQVLGFVSRPDDREPPAGQYGIEAQYNKLMAGMPGTIEEGKPVTPSVPGGEVHLTIDQNVQARAEEILRNLVTQYHAVGGTIIVQEPSTGKVVAMSSEPSFDPNNYRESPLANFINPAVQGLYEPGSVFKPITMAAAIDSGAITPETTYNDTGAFTADGKTIKNWDLKAHGTLTMTNVIEQSVNTGTVFAEKKTGHKTFYNYLIKFGLKELTDIELPGEQAGRLTPLEKFPRDINFATASYGQGVAVTPIRLISAISAIANGGVMNQPFITTGAKSENLRRVISAGAAEQVTTMMVSAVKKAKIADIPHYQVAGKTGTAFVPDFKSGGYTDKVINTYVGFAPAYSPRFTILIKLDQPENAPLAGTTVVPAFRELAEFLLNYYNVPPDLP